MGNAEGLFGGEEAAETGEYGKVVKGVSHRENVRMLKSWSSRRVRFI